MIFALFFILFLFAVLSYRKPVWALGTILALLPTYLVRFDWAIPSTLLELLTVVFLFMVAVRMEKSDWTRIKNLGGFNWVIGLFVLAALVATAFSPNLRAALGQLKAFIVEPVLLFYAAVLILRAAEDQKTALKYLLASATTLSVFGIIQYFTYIFLPIRFWGAGEEVARITSVFEYPNAFALYLAPLIAFFGILWQKGFHLSKNRAWMGLSLILQVIALILTFSRGAWLALLLAALLLFAAKLDYKKLLGIAGVILILLAVPSVRQRLSVGFTDPSSAAHLDLMKAGAIQVASNPLLGSGLAGFPTALRQLNFPGEILNYPHNIFLNFWVELGLLGLISFALIVVYAFRQHGRKRAVITFAAGVYLVVLILHGLVDVPYFKNDLAVLFWFIVALGYTPEN